PNGTTPGNRRSPKKTHCAYCIALRALRDYQRALNHEREKSIPHRPTIYEFDVDDNSETLERSSTAMAAIEAAGTGLILNNPLVMSLSIVCQQLSRLLSNTPASELPFSKIYYQAKAKRLEQLIRLMGREILLTSRTQSVTKEWWNIHDDTEQFVVRLQSTSPTDLAFIHQEEIVSEFIVYNALNPSYCLSVFFFLQVDRQLFDSLVEADVIWPRLQSRLGHYNFLRNAYLSAVTGLSTDENNPNPSERTRSRPIECPTCFQPHSAKTPTFVLLPGCWHSLCLNCHHRIATMSEIAQRRCPICRTPFESKENTGMNARRRRPLTLIHYGGNETKQENQMKSEDIEEDLNIVGDHSTKVRAVIRCLKAIKRDDPDAKAIVFSSVSQVCSFVCFSKKSFFSHYVC
ncbi:unnamed protein product, partial [Trichobilharzia regenti]